jgi:hypothetical protein
MEVILPMKTHTKTDIIESIVEIANDYKDGYIMNNLHVENWISQFDDETQIPILTEVENTLRNYYVSKADAYNFLQGLLDIKEIFSSNFLNSYKNIRFLDIQERGNSQKDLLELMNNVLEDTYGIGVDECGIETPSTYIYLDDCLYSGNRVYRDIQKWIKNAEPNTELHLIFYGMYNSNFNYRNNQIKDLCSNKKIKYYFWRLKEINNNIFGDQVDICWPANVEYSDDVYDFIDNLDEKRTDKQRENISLLRDINKQLNSELFSNSHNRAILEREFLEKGVYIYNLIENPNDSMKPMGYDYNHSLGFGSMFITYRNIANNCPIVLWWGDKEKQYPINQWYPLFPRTVNNE